jgi:hypothetical protein
MKRSMWISLVVLPAGLLMACGGDDTSDADVANAQVDDTQRDTADSTAGTDDDTGAPAVDPCGLLSEDEVSAAIGLAMEPGRQEDPLALSGVACAWDAAPGDGRTVEISLEVLDQMPVEIGGPSAEPVSGLGNEAVWDTPGVLMVVTDGTFFQVWISHMYDQLNDPREEADDETARSAATQLAELVVDRL